MCFYNSLDFKERVSCLSFLAAKNLFQTVTAIYRTGLIQRCLSQMFTVRFVKGDKHFGKINSARADLMTRNHFRVGTYSSIKRGVKCFKTRNDGKCSL